MQLEYRSSLARLVMIHVLDIDLLQQQHLLHLHESVVAKEPAKIVFYVSTRQEEFKTFKGVKIDKLRDWPRLRQRDWDTGASR